MQRRQLLRSASAAVLGITALAGCGAPGPGVEETPIEETPREETPQETETPTETPGESPTETPTATPEGTSTETPAGTPTETSTAAGGGPTTNTIEMVTEGDNFFFDPIGLFVEPGETIIWRLESGTHSTTAWVPDNSGVNSRRIPEDAASWNSGTLTQEGATFEHTFEVSGTYDYYCVPHLSLGMVGRLVVGEPGGVEGDPPQGDLPSEQRIVQEKVVTWEEF